MTPIRELIEAVEAGTLTFPQVQAWGHHATGHSGDVWSAYLGSVDAALALKEAVLPEWRMDRLRERRGGIWGARLMPSLDGSWHRKDRDPLVEVWSQTPARALLLAILRAMEAQQ